MKFRYFCTFGICWKIAALSTVQGFPWTPSNYKTGWVVSWGSLQEADKTQSVVGQNPWVLQYRALPPPDPATHPGRPIPLAQTGVESPRTSGRRRTGTRWRPLRRDNPTNKGPSWTRSPGNDSAWAAVARRRASGRSWRTGFSGSPTSRGSASSRRTSRTTMRRPWRGTSLSVSNSSSRRPSIIIVYGRRRRRRFYPSSTIQSRRSPIRTEEPLDSKIRRTFRAGSRVTTAH